MSDEITLTLTCLSNQSTESISVSLNSTKLSELCEFAAALLGLPSSDNLILSKDGKPFYTNSQQGGTQPISSVGIKNDDFIVVSMTASAARANAPAPATAPSIRTAVAAPSIAGGGLDFTSLLGAPAAASTPSSTTTGSSGGGGLTFNLAQAQLPMFNQTTPVQWAGMNLDDCIARNPNPDCFIRVLLDEPRHPNLIKELNYHSPALANRLKTAGGVAAATAIWRDNMQKNTMNATLSKTMSRQKEAEMERRLHLNPMDEEANKFFGEKISKRNVEEQYQQMMEEFPESMGRVLMLYIDAEVNGHAIQAFVDSGAESTIMSSKCAEQCGLLHLLDTRFSGIAVGVGTGKISGRIHVAEMKVNGHIFPCTITIMDGDGLGDKNMDFLLGLDMLKRHRCNIDLGSNMLVFSVGSGKMETPFLHEKDLNETKGGTKDFDAEKSNKEVERRYEEHDAKMKEGDDDEKMKGDDE